MTAIELPHNSMPAKTKIAPDTKDQCLLIADLHLHHLPTWRLEWCETFVKEILDCARGADTDKCERKVIVDDATAQAAQDSEHLVLLGDVFEMRDKVDSRMINLALKLVLSWCQMRPDGHVVWICGQHDSYRPGRGTLEGLDCLDRVHIVADDLFEWSVGQHLVHCLPFCRSHDRFRELVEQIPDGATVMTHLPLSEAVAEFGVSDKPLASLQDFARFRATYSGDVHKFRSFKKENFHYVGAPSQRDFRDKNVQGRIGVWRPCASGAAEFERYSVTHPHHIDVSGSIKSALPTEGAELCVRISDEDEFVARIEGKYRILSKRYKPIVLQYVAPDVDAPEEMTPSERIRRYVESQEGMPEDMDSDDAIRSGIELFEEMEKSDE